MKDDEKKPGAKMKWVPPALEDLGSYGEKAALETGYGTDYLRSCFSHSGDDDFCTMPHGCAHQGSKIRR
jgi:hypothetical protein